MASLASAPSGSPTFAGLDAKSASAPEGERKEPSGGLAARVSEAQAEDARVSQEKAPLVAELESQRQACVAEEAPKHGAVVSAASVRAQAPLQVLLSLSLSLSLSPVLLSLLSP